MDNVKVIVYYRGNRYGEEEVHVDSVKDAIIKTICDSSYPEVYKEGTLIHKISFKRFNMEKVKEHRRYTIHTVKTTIDLTTRDIKVIHEYWLV